MIAKTEHKKNWFVLKVFCLVHLDLKIIFSEVFFRIEWFYIQTEWNWNLSVYQLLI